MTVIHVQNQRNDHVPISGKSQNPVKFLPVRNIKTCVIETRMEDVLSRLSGPGSDEYCPVVAHHDRLTVEHVGAPRHGNSQAIDSQLMKPLDAGLNHLLVRPSHQPIGCSAIEKVVLAGTFPHKVPWIFWIDSDRAATAPLGCSKTAREAFPAISLPIFHEISVVS